MGRRRKFTNEFKLGAVQLAERLTSEEHDEPIRLPVRSPDLNAYGEGWIRSPRQECLDRIVLLKEAHLRWVLREYVRYHDERRAHQSLGHLPPEVPDAYPSDGRIAARPALGDLINDCSASPPNGVLSPRYRPGLLVCAWRDPWRSPWQALCRRASHPRQHQRTISECRSECACAEDASR